MSEKIKLQVNHSKHQGNKQEEKKEPPKQEPVKPLDPKVNATGQTAGEPLSKKQGGNSKDQKSVITGNAKEQTNSVQQANKNESNNGKQPTNKKVDDIKKLDTKNPNQKQNVDPKNKGKSLEPVREVPKPIIQQIEQSKRRISKNLQELLGQYKEMAGLAFENHGHNPEKEESIKQFLHNFKLEKQQRRLRRKQSLSVVEESEAKRKKRLEQSMKEKQLEVQKEIMNRLEQMKKKKDERSELQKERHQAFNEVNQRKPKFQQIEKQQQEKLKQQQQQLELKLKQLSRKFKPMDEEEIQQHILRYDQARQGLQEEKESEHLKFQEKVAVENEQFQKDIWRGDCHRIAYLERKQIEQEKRKGREKFERMKWYRQVVRERHQPSTSRKNDEEKEVDSSEAKSEKIGEKVRIYKFQQGVALGQKTLVVLKKKSDQEQRALGNQYLENLKSLPKKKHQATPEEENTTIDATERKKPRKQPLERYEREGNPLYSKRRENFGSDNSPYRLNNIFSRLKNQDDFVRKQEMLLKHQNLPSIMDYHDRQRNINEKLFQSAEHKINLLDHMVSI